MFFFNYGWLKNHYIHKQPFEGELLRCEVLTNDH